MSTTTAIGPTGYTCVVCHQWVLVGNTHSCTNPVWVNPPPPPPKLVDLRIAEALERIAAALEAGKDD